MEKVMITGNLGYIGSILTNELLKEDYEVIGVDTNFYRDGIFIPFDFIKEYKQLFLDIRDIQLDDLYGINTIIHLAALSNDPLGKLNPQLTHDINYLASLRLANLSKKAGASRFIFSSSCSIYGQTQDEKLGENAPMRPLSAYAKSKVDLEIALSNLASDEYSPIYMRNGTAYGISPNMRFDLVINNLTGWGFTTKIIKILSDGKAWRPIVHIQDISNAFIAALKAPRELIHNEAFNVGINSENFQVRQMAQAIYAQMKECEVQIIGEDNPDQRNYIVNFDKIRKNLKFFKPKWTLKKGINELIETFKKINLSYNTFQDKNYTRIKQLNFLLKKKMISNQLRWV